MQTHLAFGKDGLPLQLPEGFEYRLLEAHSVAPLADERAALEAALDAPIDSPPLSQLARGARSAAISVCDITRPAPNSTVLPPVLARLEAAGIPRQGIVILIATGLHRPATDDEIRRIVGPEIASRYRVENHDARCLADHRFLGNTASGTPAYIDERFVSADLRLTLGFIEPHLMLGFSGGRKLITPGLAAQETIKVIHSPRFMRHPRTHEGSIADNPLHAELLEIARMAGHSFMLDVALTRDRRIAQVFAGHPERAHLRGTEFVGSAMREVLDAPADAVITTAAGYPLDLTFYQALKGATAAARAVKPGGRILLVASCDEGAGSPEFCDLLRRYSTDREFLAATADAPVIVDQWQLDKFAQVTARARVSFYTPGLPREFHPTAWGTVHPTLHAAVSALLEGLAPGARVAVMPDGPYVLV
jgi:nickel-dependent lactate racemase